MTIDLSTLKSGDTVEFRCGGKAIVRHVGSDSLFHLSFGNAWVSYFENGNYCGRIYEFDIVAIHPAKVKRSGEIWWVVYDNCDSVFPQAIATKDQAIEAAKYARKKSIFKILAITNKTTWVEGDGLELLEDGE